MDVSDDLEQEDVSDIVGIGCGPLEKFTEWKEVSGFIEDLKNVTPVDLTASPGRSFFDKPYERFKYIINLYKEQPHLIDSHLSLLLDQIVGIVRSEEYMPELKHFAFKYMHLIINVRGYKIVIQHLPHAAADLEPVMSMLESQDKADTSTWETRYCLLLWLSIIVKIPFHMSRLDAESAGDSPSSKVMDRLFKICQEYLLVSDLCREASAHLSSVFLTRSDASEVYLTKFLEWACVKILNKNELARERLGPLLALAAILKHGQRETMLKHTPDLLKTILELDWKKEPYRLSRKLAVKIIQRIGLTFLKTRVISWRYQRGARSLADTLALAKDKVVSPKEEETKEEEIQADDAPDFPQEIEEIIDELMHGLRDQDLTVRWSAAKGIGRIMGRMSRQLGDEVVGCVMDLLGPRENEDAWHGGCLALAELSRRGLLLPTRLPEVIPLVKKALVYDEPRGYISVGSIVRDAACYVCWTFARAYESNILKPFVRDIATALIIVACFDREVNIRRAASAAFQEHIGRQGTFPHGIDILTAADYFTVGVRNNSYLSISVYVAQFEEYTGPIIDHLVERKLEHWDVAIRELSAKALHLLTPRSPDYMMNDILPILIKKSSSIDVNVRHGAIMALGEIVHALSLSKTQIKLNTEIYNAIKDLVKMVRERHQFRGLSGELMKIACCHLIYKCSLAKLSFPSDVIKEWQTLIDECIRHEVSNIRTRAATALSALCSEYYQKDGQIDIEQCTAIVDSYIAKLEASDQTVRLGHAIALGSLPPPILKEYLDKIVKSIIACTKIAPETEKWVESRRSALNALSSITTSVGLNAADEKSCRNHLPMILECMVHGLDDYTQDDRGDTGAWVRESSMSGIQVILTMGAEYCPDLLPENLVREAFTGVVQQAIERIDRTRALAGTVFSSILHCPHEVPHIPERAKVLELFPKELCESQINWLSHDPFPKFVLMLALPSYTYKLVCGLIMSAGGLTESLVRASTSCLFGYLGSQSVEEQKRICDIIANIYEANLQCDRVTVPMLRFLDLLLSSGCIRLTLESADDSFPDRAFTCTRIISTGTTNKYKLLGSVDVFCQLIQVGGKASKKALGRLLIQLAHPYGWLRQAVATKLYEALMLYSDSVGLTDEEQDEVLNILSDTEWSFLPMDQVRPLRNKLCQILNIAVPIPVKKTAD